MKHLVLGTSIALMSLTGAASAADLAVRPVAAAVVDPIYWNGFYIGGNIGYSAGRLQNDILFGGATIATERHNLDGIMGGGQVGANGQFGRMVIGLEIDAQATGQRNTRNFAFPGGAILGIAIPAFDIDARQKLDWFGTARGRVGFLATDSTLLYATGGAAFGGVSSNYVLNAGGVAAIATVSAYNTKAGWTVGAGIEQKWGAWSAKAEYLYIDLGRENLALAIPGLGATAALTTRVTDNIGRLGINYHFNSR